MKHLIFLFSLLVWTACLFGQSQPFQDVPNKMRTGDQTTGRGLVPLYCGVPDWSPSNVKQAWAVVDTCEAPPVIRVYADGAWNELSGAAVNIGNTDLTLTGNRRLNTGGYQFWIQDGTGSEVPYIFIGGDQVSFAASTTTSVYLDSSEQRAAIVAGAVIDLDADSIRIIGTQPNDNTLNRLLALDTITNRLHYVDKASIEGGSGTDTNFAEDNLTFSGNRVHNLSTRTLTIADGGTYPTYQQSSATDGITIASSATDLIAQTPGLLQIENSDTITITADRIRMNAADTRIQQVSKNNALNRVMMIDSTTEQVYYRDVSSIAGGGGGSGTVTSITAGVGLNGGTITTSGTIDADTSGMLVTKSFLTNQGYTTNTGTVTGTGTTGTIPVWSSSSALGDSPLTITGTDTVRFASVLKHFNSTAARRWGLYTRASVAFPVPYFKPDAAESGSSNIAVDVMPRGTPGNYGSEGISWMDICDTDIEQFGDGGSYLRLGITSTAATVRSKKLAGLQKPLSFGIQNTDRIYIDTTGRLTFSFYTALSDSTLLQPKYAFYSSGGGLVYQNPIGNFRVTNPTNATEESLQKTLYDIRAAGSIPSGTSGATLRHNGTSFVSSTYLKNTDARVDIGTTSSQLWLGSDPTGSSTYSLILRQYQFFTDATTTGSKLLLRNYTGTPANLLIFPSSTSDAYIFFPSSATETSSAGLRLSTGKSIANAYAIEAAPAISQTAPGGAVGGISWTSTITPNHSNNLAAAKMIGINIAPSYSGTQPTQKAEFRGISITPTITRGGSADSTSSGIFIDPVLTSTSQFFGVRSNISSSEGWSYYEQGTAPSAFGGSVAIGTTAAPARTLSVTGEARITDLTTDTPTLIVGADADGDLGAITLGSGLSLTSGTLSATGGAGTVTSVGITAPAAGITVSGSPVTSSGNMTLALADDLAAVEGLSANGIATRTASNTWTARTITAGSGIAVTNGDGVSGNPTISRTYSLTHITISGGSTFFGTTPERPDNDTGGSVTVSTVGSDFGVSGSTLDYTGPGGALLRVEGSVSFSVADDGDYYLSIFKEGTEIAATSTRISCVAGNYYTVALPATTTTGATNDTFDVRIATVTGNSTTTMHRYGFIIERVY